jgi:hypothetical protein
MLPSISEEYQRCDQEQVHNKKKITIKNKQAKKKKKKKKNKQEKKKKNTHKNTLLEHFQNSIEKS